MRDRLEAALEGNLVDFMAEELDLTERAVTSGVHGRADRLKAALRRSHHAPASQDRLARWS